MRILRVYHSAVVPDYRERERHIAGQFGHEVELVCPPEWNEGGRVVEAPVGEEFPVHVVDVHGRRHPNLFWYDRSQLRRVLRAFRPEVVDLHEEPHSLAVGFALRDVRIEVPDARVFVYTAQNLYKRYPVPFRLLERRTYARATAIYPCSTEAGEVARTKGFLGPLWVIPLGTSERAVVAHPSSGALRVGFIGRLESYKGGAIALRAFAGALRGHNAELHIVGDGPERDELVTGAALAGVESQVRFHGAMEQHATLDLLSTLDVVLIPSLTTPNWKEQFGRVAVEAMAAGVVVVASASGSLPEVIGDAGYLTPEGDATAVAAVLKRLADDQVELEAMRRRSLDRARRYFIWPRVAADFDAMYSDTNDASWSYVD